MEFDRGEVIPNEWTARFSERVKLRSAKCSNKRKGRGSRSVEEREEVEISRGCLSRGVESRAKRREKKWTEEEAAFTAPWTLSPPISSKTPVAAKSWIGLDPFVASDWTVEITADVYR